MPKRIKWNAVALLGMGFAASLLAQGTVPVFEHAVNGQVFTLAGGDPAKGAEIKIAVTLVPVTLVFPDSHASAQPVVMRSESAAAVLASPVFAKHAFRGEEAQYADALLRATIHGSGHTLLEKAAVKPITVTVPAANGYVLTSKRDGGRIAIVDMQYVQREAFRQVPKQRGLVMLVTENATFYAEADNTICCATGTHGVDKATGNSFVLASYFSRVPTIVKERDVQPLTQQLAEFVNDPLHDPLAPGNKPTGNVVAQPWKMAMGGCGGRGVGSAYFLLQPTNTNHKNNFPFAPAFVAGKYHLSNVATLNWYAGGVGVYSFPDTQALKSAAQQCGARRTDNSTNGFVPTVVAVANGKPGAHRLIGYWNGSRDFKLRDVAAQWDIVIEAFATPDHAAAEGTLKFHPPSGYTPEQLKSDIAWMKQHGRKVMISLGGGGQFFSMDKPESVKTFVDSVSGIVSQYGFDGVDIDFETPSFDIDAKDKDFRHPTTPGIVHLIAGLRALRQRFGAGFMISLVPEGTQIPAGAVAYGGQYGSYLPLAYGLRDVLSFVDVQDYNTPPLQGLDGEIYQSATTDYHAMMTEMLLHGFAVNGDKSLFFPPLPADKVAIGLLTGYEDVQTMRNGVEYVLTGKKPADATYRLINPKGYAGMLGAMFWTIDADRRENYRYSNVIGPLLHGDGAASQIRR